MMGCDGMEWPGPDVPRVSFTGGVASRLWPSHPHQIVEHICLLLYTL